MRLPDWLRTRNLPGLHAAKQTLRKHRVSTVCEEARCPNISTCFSKPTATFMILGSSCTRRCGFCSVESSEPDRPDDDEPERIALAAQDMGLKYVVITSVTRDDLSDGGAAHFAMTVQRLKEYLPGCRVEVLTPDFKGNAEALMTVLSAAPDLFGHNIETVPRLYRTVRPGAVYERSLRLLRQASEMAPQIPIKSGFMVGLGETSDEVVRVMEDIRSSGCDFLTIGQYLRPSKRNLPVFEYVTPETFDRYKERALSAGFRGVASGPLVRSSYRAEEMFLQRFCYSNRPKNKR